MTSSNVADVIVSEPTPEIRIFIKQEEGVGAVAQLPQDRKQRQQQQHQQQILESQRQEQQQPTQPSSPRADMWANLFLPLLKIEFTSLRKGKDVQRGWDRGGGGN